MPYLPAPNRTMCLSLADEVPIHIHFWDPASEPQGIILFLHGLAEHAMRYAAFAGSLAKQGWLVAMPDLRGHGLSADGKPGIAGVDGWNGMVRDAVDLIKRLREAHPTLPFVLGGYSMGSMIAQRIAQTEAAELTGMFLIGTGMPTAGYEGLVLAMQETESLGRDAPSEISRWVFREFCNRPFEPVNTPFDWLTSDQEAAAEYTNDPLCGIPISSGFYTDYQAAMAITVTPESYSQIPRELPLLILNGIEDTSAPAEAVIALIRKLAEIGAQDVTWRLYPGLRHDLLHETRRVEIEQDIHRWIQRLRGS